MKVKSVQDRLLRGEDPDDVMAVAETFAEDTLTLGFARRIATYKRLFLLTYDPERVRRIFADGPPLQLVVAGKAHPLDDNAKRMLVDVFGLSESVGITSRVAFLENYDLSVAPPIVGGCDVWLNVPRPPLEASGTSGMKSAANGGLNLSVLDGWWVEGYDGENGWEIDGHAPEGEDEAATGRAPRPRALRPPRAAGDPALPRPRRRRHPAALARDGEALAADERPALLGRADGRGVRARIYPPA